MRTQLTEEFINELATLINKHSLEDGSNTPDFLLTEYLIDCLLTYNKVIRAREKWYGRDFKQGEWIIHENTSIRPRP